MKIAIHGHPTRGKEIIQILKSLGGKNKEELNGSKEYWYFINSDGYIRNDYKSVLQYKGFKTYTLEEFEKEFPFKIGDRVKHITSVGTIKEYCYIDNEPAYKVKSIELGIIATIPVKILEPYKEMKEERNITLTLDKAKEWYKKGGELKEIALQAFSEKELNLLPRSWEEYNKKYGGVCLSTRYTNTSLKNHDALIKLEQLRDCWRQGWVQTPTDTGYRISKTLTGDYVVMYVGYCKHFLSFPTREMTKEFLECFRDLIEKAGDLI